MRYPKHIILDISTPKQVRKNNFTTYNIIEDHDYSFNTPIDSFVTYANLSLTKTSPIRELKLKNISYFQSLMFELHFIRKEKLYTKLKYSRCPQYDIVSGGFAALLAGFIGFLISEKFGIELVDSADFYNAFMYGVFAVLALRPLIYIYSKDAPLYTPLSPKYLFLFIKHSFILLYKELSFFLLKIKTMLKLK
jgi:hypothetical protein